jgi:hypothetical protein
MLQNRYALLNPYNALRKKISPSSDVFQKNRFTYRLTCCNSYIVRSLLKKLSVNEEENVRLKQSRYGAEMV